MAREGFTELLGDGVRVRVAPLIGRDQLRQEADRQKLPSQEKQPDTIQYGGPMVEGLQVQLRMHAPPQPITSEVEQAQSADKERDQSHGTQQVLRTMAEAGEESNGKQVE